MDNRNDHAVDDLVRTALRSMPEEPAPADFASGVMERLAPRKASIWRRIYMWMTRPRSMRFTPLQVAPVAVCALALMGLLLVKNGYLPDQEPSLTPVRFVLNDQGQGIRAVSVIGSFNDWRADGAKMWYDDDSGRWVLEAMLPPGDHEYTFLINGETVMPDPQAQMIRDDGFGNKNSVIFVDGPNEQSL